MNQTNTLSEILILLKEANKDQRRTLFKNILNHKIDKKAFIYTKHHSIHRTVRAPNNRRTSPPPYQLQR